VFVKTEKSILIKTLSVDRDEYEIALEAFLNNEYNPDSIYENPSLIKKELKITKDESNSLDNDLNSEKIEHMTSQMKFRLQEGQGETKYEIGKVIDNTHIGLSKEDMLHHLRTFCIIASKLQADVIILHMRNASFGKIAEILVRSNQREGIKLDIKIMLLGDKQSGKSTLIGVLTSGKLDNGKGSVRALVQTHKHEITSGETSTLSHHILGFDSQGSVINNLKNGGSSWEEIVDSSTKILTFMDIGGHEKYTPKIVSGLCSFYPDYTIIVVSAVDGVTNITEQHLNIACVFGMPYVIVITHVDLINENRLYELKNMV